MNLRIIKVFAPLEHKLKVEECLRECEVSDFWQDRISEKKVLVHALVPAVDSEKLLDALENALHDVEDFKAVIMPVEGSVPRMKGKEEEEKKKGRISREELYTKISGSVGLSWIYLVLVVFSAIIAAIGLVHGNIPMVVGAMIIAPFLFPNVALCFATVSGDLNLAARAVKIIFSGVFLALFFSAGAGFFFDVDVAASEIVSRTEVGAGDIIVSLLSGSVAVLSLTTAMVTSIAGVMIAVALLPPLIVSGILLGAGSVHGFAGALLLFFINLVGINLAGVVTFILQGVRPRTVLQFTKAQIFTFFALVFWFTLFIIALFLTFK